MIRAIFVALGVVAVASLPVTAQSQVSKAAKSRTGGDQTFVTHAAAGGMAEVEIGKLAADKATSNGVKQFALRMVSDHGEANNELKSLAQRKNITLPTNLDPKEKALRDRLSKLSGIGFDRAYMNAMLQDHRMALTDFRKEAQTGADPDIKAFAAKTLPTLEEHLKAAQRAGQGVVATTGTRPTAPPRTKK